MTVREMKQDTVKRISLLNESDAKTMRSIWLFVSSALQNQQEKNAVVDDRTKAKELAHSFLGAFSGNNISEDWKKEKEDYLLGKYADL